MLNAGAGMVFDNTSCVCSFPLFLLQIELLLSVAPRRARDPWWHGCAWTLDRYVLCLCATCEPAAAYRSLAYHESIWNRYGIDHRQHSASACGPAHGPHHAIIETSR